MKFIIIICCVLQSCLFCVYSQDVIPIHTINSNNYISANDQHPYLNEATFLYYDFNTSFLYVVNKRDNNILVFDDKLQLVRTIGRYGQGPGEFERIYGVSTSCAGQIIVTDRGRIQVFSTDGLYQAGFRINIRSVTFPVCACMDSRQNVYVPQFNNDKLITVYDLEGNEIAKFGDVISIEQKQYKGTLSQTLDNYIHLRIDNSDNIYVVFQNQPIVRRYDCDYNLIYEKNIEWLEAIKIKKQRAAENRKRVRGHSTDYIFNDFFHTICDDMVNLYLFTPAGSTPVAVVDKKNGEVKKLYRLLNKDKLNYMIDHIATDGQRFFASSHGEIIITEK
ncbi:6-bladed beta-propeller [bacterium]|nr:6-bladed beta-propeller [bacterium]